MYRPNPTGTDPVGYARWYEVIRAVQSYVEQVGQDGKLFEVADPPLCRAASTVI